MRALIQIPQRGVPITADLIDSLGDTLAEQIVNGERDALECFTLIKAFEAALAKAKKRVQPFAIERAYDLSEGSFKFLGAQVVVKKNGRYEYDESPELTRISEDKAKATAELRAQLAEIEDPFNAEYARVQKLVLAASQAKKPIEDPETGQTIAPVSFKGDYTIAITLPKE